MCISKSAKVLSAGIVFRSLWLPVATERQLPDLFVWHKLAMTWRLGDYDIHVWIPQWIYRAKYGSAGLKTSQNSTDYAKNQQGFLGLAMFRTYHWQQWSIHTQYIKPNLSHTIYTNNLRYSSFMGCFFRCRDANSTWGRSPEAQDAGRAPWLPCPGSAARSNGSAKRGL